MDARWHSLVSKLLSANAFKSGIDGEHVDTLLNFKFFKDLSQNVQQEISKIVQLVRCPVGKVLFRQGDLPGSCYVILEGTVGIFVKSEELMMIDSKNGTPRADQHQGTRLELLELAADEDPKVERFPTREGFSFYHHHSNFGTQIATLCGGHMLGELALMSDANRAATAICLKECDLLAVPKNDFALLLKMEIVRQKKEKTQFLKDHVPMYRELSSPEYWSNYFQESHVDRDHIFLQQGEMSNESFWILCEGSVGFWHTKSKETTRTYWLQGIEESNPDHRCKNYSRQSGRNRMCLVGSSLVAGGSFGALPTGEPEMFTVRASSACKLLHLPHKTFKRYPQKQIDAIYDYIVQCTSWRMSCIIHGLEAKSGLTATKALSRDRKSDVEAQTYCRPRHSKLKLTVPLHAANAAELNHITEDSKPKSVRESSSMPLLSGAPSTSGKRNTARSNQHSQRPHSAGKGLGDLYSNCTWQPPSASKVNISSSNILRRPSSAGRLVRSNAFPERRYLVDVSRPIPSHPSN